MNEYIAYCGLNCEACEARIATVNHDDALRRRVAKEWSELNGVEIAPEMINCTGCRIDGPKTPYCESLCPIRQCAMKKQIQTCGSCAEMGTCEKLAAITGNNPDAVKNLREYRTLSLRDCRTAAESGCGGHADKGKFAAVSGHRSYRVL